MNVGYIKSQPMVTNYP